MYAFYSDMQESKIYDTINAYCMFIFLKHLKFEIDIGYILLVHTWKINDIDLFIVSVVKYFENQ